MCEFRSSTAGAALIATERARKEAVSKSEICIFNSRLRELKHGRQ
jgi:hypothetical protein